MACAVLLLLCLPVSAHSGKARFHVVIDTDGAADDLRALLTMLGNRESEVLALVSSEGALRPHQTAVNLRMLLNSLYHEGVPVGEGRTVEGYNPQWRSHSEQIEWGDGKVTDCCFEPAVELLETTLEDEEEPVYYLALGALTNLADLLERNPRMKDEIAEVIWYNESIEPLCGANYEADRESAKKVLGSGLKISVVGTKPHMKCNVSQSVLDSLGGVPTPYARRIVRTHSAAPLAGLVEAGHLQFWDDLVPLYLYFPEMFICTKKSRDVQFCRLTDSQSEEDVVSGVVALLRGKPDAESRVFYGFPTDARLYDKDVASIIESVIRQYGESEFRACVLTNELHGHLGIYASIGVKMGIRAREYFNIGVDDIEVVSLAGSHPPVSCMNDGLQVGTGGTVGHGLIRVLDCRPPRPKAYFSFKEKTISLALKEKYARRIREDVRRGIALHGDKTKAYWEYVRALALKYWQDFDRHEIFDMEVLEGKDKIPDCSE